MQADEFVDRFYQHLLGYEEPRRLLSDPVVRNRLLAKQREYLMSLVRDEIDPDYVELRLQIGQVHERIGLAPRWYLGAYELYRNGIDRLVLEHYAGDPERAARARGAFSRRISFDTSLAMETYIDRREEQLEFANRELAKAHRGLSREVGVKTEALRETEARAQVAEQLATVGVLAAGLAHEIGTPMGVIRGHAESLSNVVDDERSRWRVDTIIEQIDRITNIMQALLNLARPRAPVIEDVEITSVLETSVSFLGEKLARRGIDVVKNFAEVPPIRGDSEKLQQLFLNLILNGADAMPDGGTLSLSVEREAGNSLRVAIGDTGIGIEPEQLQRIFEPFFTTKAAGEGNGLGLVVARGIALDHGGELSATSSRNGTEFSLTLPC